MLKRVLSVLLSVVMILSIFFVIPTTVYAADGVYNKIMSLQNRFPNGKYWDHQVTNGYNNGDQLKAAGDESYSDYVTSYPCATHSGTAAIWQYDCNYFDGGMQCWGFACKIFFETFGVRASKLPKRTDINNISVGDYLRYGTDSNGHSAIVLSRNGDSITVVECNNLNYGGFCNIHWGGESNINSVSYFKHASNWDSINNSYHSEPSASFSDWWNDNYTFITSTNAAIGQEVNTSGGSFTRVGMILYDNSGNRLGVGSDTPVDGLKRYFYNINTELGVTLDPNKTYKYQFFADVGGKTFYSDMKQFTTPTITFKDWSNDRYTYIGTTDASIGQEVAANGSGCTEIGMILYDIAGNQLAKAYGGPSNYTDRYYFKINEELGYTLTPGTTYKYRFYAIVNGTTYYSEFKSFTSIPEAEVEMSWGNALSLPSKNNAFVTAKAIAPTSGTFSFASIRVFTEGGVLVASKEETAFAHTGSSLYLYYDVYKDTGVHLQPSQNYVYRILATFNGHTYESPIYSFTTEGANDRHFGIDVSSHQEYINWETAANYIDYAIIRCGYGSDYSANDDQYWEYNASECERLGIPYGVYLYSYAENDAEAASEAEHVLRLLKGHSPSLPVYYDLEDNGTVGKLSTSQIGGQAKIFCDKIKAAGYDAGVYANLSWWNNKLTSGTFGSYHKWVAAYGDFDLKSWEMWQYSSGGSVPGINGNVDMNYSRESVQLKTPTVKPTEKPPVPQASVILGDADSDGTVTILDATTIQRHLASLPTTSYNNKAADADEDGEVTIIDATCIQRHLASLPTHNGIGNKTK